LFLLREDYTPYDLFKEIRADLNLKGGTVSVDDAVLDKSYSHLLWYWFSPIILQLADF